MTEKRISCKVQFGRARSLTTGGNIIMQDAPFALDRVNLPLFISVARHIFTAAENLLCQSGQSDKRGGYCAVFENEISNPGLLFHIGESPQDKLGKRIEVALEKGRRLQNWPEHLTSFQSRNHNVGCWGGAIRGRNFIFSFSGLPELWDEAVTFVLAIRLRQLQESDVLRQIGEDRNPHLRPLLEITHCTE